jgi:hypothetical protein
MPTSPSRSLRTAFILLIVALVAAACGGSATKTVDQPTTDAHLTIISPTPNEVTGPNLTLKFSVTGATISQPDVFKIVPNEGHIHVSLDGKLVQMAYQATTEVAGLAPGEHTLQAEFVANNHLPFANPVLAVVIFTVKG